MLALPEPSYSNSCAGLRPKGHFGSNETLSSVASLYDGKQSVFRDALDTIKLKTSRVCPLVCEHGFKADGDRCTSVAPRFCDG